MSTTAAVTKLAANLEDLIALSPNGWVEVELHVTTFSPSYNPNDPDVYVLFGTENLSPAGAGDHVNPCVGLRMRWDYVGGGFKAYHVYRNGATNIEEEFDYWSAYGIFEEDGVGFLKFRFTADRMYVAGSNEAYYLPGYDWDGDHRDFTDTWSGAAGLQKDCMSISVANDSSAFAAVVLEVNSIAIWPWQAGGEPAPVVVIYGSIQS